MGGWKVLPMEMQAKIAEEAENLQLLLVNKELNSVMTMVPSYKVWLWRAQGVLLKAKTQRNLYGCEISSFLFEVPSIRSAINANKELDPSQKKSFCVRVDEAAYQLWRLDGLPLQARKKWNKKNQLSCAADSWWQEKFQKHIQLGRLLLNGMAASPLCVELQKRLPKLEKQSWGF